MTRVSVLIFSMNKVDKVMQLATKLRDFVDEIVIIDSSKKRNYELLKRKIPFAKIYWVPPVGCVELLYQLGINLTNNDWVLHLEDDEEPNEEFLRNLKKIISKPDAKVYRVIRINTRLKTMQKIIRLFNKKYIIATGCIHWCWKSKVGYADLDGKYIIYHHTENLASLKKRIKRLWNFSIIESYQWGYKISKTKYFYDKNFLGALLRFQIKLGKIGWYLLATEFNLYMLYYGLFKARNEAIIDVLLYWLFIQINITRNFGKKLEIWFKIIEAGNPIEFLGLQDISSAKRLTYLRDHNGIENFKRLVEAKL